MSAAPGGDAPSEARRAVELPVTLVLAGPEGLVVRTGRTVEVGAAGCRVVVDAPVAAPHGETGEMGGMVVVGGGEDAVTRLTGPPLVDGAESTVVGLRFVKSVQGDAGWRRLMQELGVEGSAA